MGCFFSYIWQRYCCSFLRKIIGKWAVAVFTALWFITQFLSHEWYTIFGSGVMGKTEEKIKYFSNALKWLETDGRYIPDVYHTILHVLILIVLITSIMYIRSLRKKDE